MTAVLPRLYLSQEPGLGRLTALEFGRVDEGQPLDCWDAANEHVWLLHDEPGGRCVGFMVRRFTAYDPEDEEHASLWDGPRFDVPALGLCDVPPNAVIVAARALFGCRPTLNRQLFSRAINADGERALERWLDCLESGDSMAHYALGYELFELGRLPEAYRHLRNYSEIAPCEPWAWCWLGKVAAALGEHAEARAAFERAIELNPDETDADELLDALDRGKVEIPELVLPDPPREWQEVVSTLVDEIGLAATYWSGEPLAHIVFDAAPVPVWLDVDGRDGELGLRVMIGVAEGVSDTAFGAEDLVDILREDAEDIVVDDDAAWLVLTLDEHLNETSPRTLELLVRGAAAAADAMRVGANAGPGSLDGDLVAAPPAYAEAASRFEADL